MATLEDAAEALVVRLKALDPEIDEARHALEEIRGQIEQTTEGVDQEWTALADAASALVQAVHEQQERIASGVAEAARASAGLGAAVGQSGARVRSEVAEGAADLAALAQHAGGVAPEVEAAVADAGEEPARRLAERVKDADEELQRVLEETRAFVEDEVPGVLSELTEAIKERCESLTEHVVEPAAASLRQTLEAWETRVDELLDHVSSQGFVASHDHAHAVAEWALDECRAACERALDPITQLAETATSSLRQFATGVQALSASVERDAAELLAEVARANDLARQGQRALDRVRRDLASYSFVAA
jgi:hypothetical protein